MPISRRGSLGGQSLGRRALASQIKSLPAPRIFGLVTTRGDFYSVLILSKPANDWCVGGIKAVQPILHDELKLSMLRED